MPTIIRRLPFVEQMQEFSLFEQKLSFLPDQIFVYVTLLVSGSEFDPKAPRFPVVLDTGTNHNLVINEGHLESLAGCKIEALPRAGKVNFRGAELATYEADVWLYFNVPGTREPRLDIKPVCIELNNGIIVTPREPLHPSVPALGIRALRSAKLRVLIDCELRLVWAGSRDRARSAASL